LRPEHRHPTALKAEGDVNGYHHRVIYGESVYVRSSSVNMYATLLSDDKDSISEKVIIREDNHTISYSGNMTDKGVVRVKEVTVAMPLGVALSFAGAILSHLQAFHPEVLAAHNISLAPILAGEKNE
ncbi:MAG: hypothetical protein WCC64_07270, partial [Aliidongia sp.]